MKKTILIINILCASILLIGCHNISTGERKETPANIPESNTQTNQNQEIDDNDTIKTDTKETINIMDKQKGYGYSQEDEDFILAGFKQLDSMDTVMELFGEPLDKSYTVRGTYKIQDQYLLTNMYYEDVIISIRDFFRDGYQDIEGIVEINITGDTYPTARGVRVGDTVDRVKEIYGMDEVLEIDGEIPNVLKTDLYNKVNHLEAYTDDKFFYEYGGENGRPESMVYIEYSDDGDSRIRPPVLVFLFHNDVVTNIILYNTVHLYV